MSSEKERLIAGLRREREWSRSESHRRAIDEQLRLLGFDVEAHYGKAEVKKEQADEPAPKPPAPARKQQPRGRTSRPGQRKAD